MENGSYSMAIVPTLLRVIGRLAEKGPVRVVDGFSKLYSRGDWQYAQTVTPGSFLCLQTGQNLPDAESICFSKETRQGE
jgi:hypothetical protein